SIYVYFFQAVNVIRVGNVTGVQTCALPILLPHLAPPEIHAESGASRDRREELPRDAAIAREAERGEEVEPEAAGRDEGREDRRHRWRVSCMDGWGNGGSGGRVIVSTGLSDG